MAILSCVLWPAALLAQQRLPPVPIASTGPTELPAETLPPPDEAKWKEYCGSFLEGGRWGTPKRVDQLSLDIRLRDEGAEGKPLIVEQDRPMDCRRGGFSAADAARADAGIGLAWPPLEFHWAAAGACHQPLYFDDVPLEHYGQARHQLLQPWISGGRFFAAFPIMPYKMVVDPPYERVSQLGYYRPGTVAPRVCQHPPWRVDAATAEAAAWLAAIFILP